MRSFAGICLHRLVSKLKYTVQFHVDVNYRSPTEHHRQYQYPPFMRSHFSQTKASAESAPRPHPDVHDPIAEPISITQVAHCVFVALLPLLSDRTTTPFALPLLFEILPVVYSDCPDAQSIAERQDQFDYYMLTLSQIFVKLPMEKIITCPSQLLIIELTATLIRMYPDAGRLHALRKSPPSTAFPSSSNKRPQASAPGLNGIDSLVVRLQEVYLDETLAEVRPDLRELIHSIADRLDTTLVADFNKSREIMASVKSLVRLQRDINLGEDISVAQLRDACVGVEFCSSQANTLSLILLELLPSLEEEDSKDSESNIMDGGRRAGLSILVELLSHSDEGIRLAVSESILKYAARCRELAEESHGDAVFSHFWYFVDPIFLDSIVRLSVESSEAGVRARETLCTLAPILPSSADDRFLLDCGLVSYYPIIQALSFEHPEMNGIAALVCKDLGSLDNLQCQLRDFFSVDNTVCLEAQEKLSLYLCTAWNRYFQVDPNTAMRSPLTPNAEELTYPFRTSETLSSPRSSPEDLVFRSMDVTNLINIVSSPSYESSVRNMAAAQLSQVLANPRFSESLLDPELALEIHRFLLDATACFPKEDESDRIDLITSFLSLLHLVCVALLSKTNDSTQPRRFRPRSEGRKAIDTVRYLSVSADIASFLLCSPSPSVCRYASRIAALFAFTGTLSTSQSTHQHFHQCQLAIVSTKAPLELSMYKGFRGLFRSPLSIRWCDGATPALTSRLSTSVSDRVSRMVETRLALEKVHDGGVRVADGNDVGEDTSSRSSNSLDFVSMGLYDCLGRRSSVTAVLLEIEESMSHDDFHSHLTLLRCLCMCDPLYLSEFCNTNWRQYMHRFLCTLPNSFQDDVLFLCTLFFLQDVLFMSRIEGEGEGAAESTTVKSPSLVSCEHTLYLVSTVVEYMSPLLTTAERDGDDGWTRVPPSSARENIPDKRHKSGGSVHRPHVKRCFFYFLSALLEHCRVMLDSTHANKTNIDEAGSITRPSRVPSLLEESSHFRRELLTKLHFLGSGTTILHDVVADIEAMVLSFGSEEDAYAQEHTPGLQYATLRVLTSLSACEAFSVDIAQRASRIVCSTVQVVDLCRISASYFRKPLIRSAIQLLLQILRLPLAESNRAVRSFKLYGVHDFLRGKSLMWLLSLCSDREALVQVGGLQLLRHLVQLSDKARREEANEFFDALYTPTVISLLYDIYNDDTLCSSSRAAAIRCVQAMLEVAKPLPLATRKFFLSIPLSPKDASSCTEIESRSRSSKVVVRVHTPSAEGGFAEEKQLEQKDRERAETEDEGDEKLSVDQDYLSGSEDQVYSKSESASSVGAENGIPWSLAFTQRAATTLSNATVTSRLHESVTELLFSLVEMVSTIRPSSYMHAPVTSDLFTHIMDDVSRPETLLGIFGILAVDDIYHCLSINMRSFDFQLPLHFTSIVQAFGGTERGGCSRERDGTRMLFKLRHGFVSDILHNLYVVHDPHYISVRNWWWTRMVPLSAIEDLNSTRGGDETSRNLGTSAPLHPSNPGCPQPHSVSISKWEGVWYDGLRPAALRSCASVIRLVLSLHRYGAVSLDAHDEDCLLHNPSSVLSVNLAVLIIDVLSESTKRNGQDSDAPFLFIEEELDCLICIVELFSVCLEENEEAFKLALFSNPIVQSVDAIVNMIEEVGPDGESSRRFECPSAILSVFGALLYPHNLSRLPNDHIASACSVMILLSSPLWVSRDFSPQSVLHQLNLAAKRLPDFDHEKAEEVMCGSLFALLTSPTSTGSDGNGMRSLLFRDQIFRACTHLFNRSAAAKKLVTDQLDLPSWACKRAEETYALALAASLQPANVDSDTTNGAVPMRRRAASNTVSSTASPEHVERFTQVLILIRGLLYGADEIVSIRFLEAGLVRVLLRTWSLCVGDSRCREAALGVILNLASRSVIAKQAVCGLDSRAREVRSRSGGKTATLVAKVAALLARHEKNDFTSFQLGCMIVQSVVLDETAAESLRKVGIIPMLASQLQPAVDRNALKRQRSILQVLVNSGFTQSGRQLLLEAIVPAHMAVILDIAGCSLSPRSSMRTTMALKELALFCFRNLSFSGKGKNALTSSKRLVTVLKSSLRSKSPRLQMYACSCIWSLAYDNQRGLQMVKSKLIPSLNELALSIGAIIPAKENNLAPLADPELGKPLAPSQSIGDSPLSLSTVISHIFSLAL